MRDTPRTDAVNGSDGSIADCEELCELARTLERELAQAKESLAEMTAQWMHVCGELRECEHENAGAVKARNKAQDELAQAVKGCEAAVRQRDAAIREGNAHVAQLAKERDEARACLIEAANERDKWQSSEMYAPWTECGCGQCTRWRKAALGDAPKG